MSITRCIKCDGQMERGFILDATYGAVVQSRWTEGIANYSKWWGLTGLKKRRMYKVGADRCVKCGFLEHYATDETKL